MERYNANRYYSLPSDFFIHFHTFDEFEKQIKIGTYTRRFVLKYYKTKIYNTEYYILL